MSLLFFEYGPFYIAQYFAPRALLLSSAFFAQLFEQAKYQDAVTLLNKLLRELKRMDDKQLLVETHLVEARVHNALRNTPKAKAALTAARTAGNSIYIAPIMQVQLSSTVQRQCSSRVSSRHSASKIIFGQQDHPLVGSYKSALCARPARHSSS